MSNSLDMTEMNQPILAPILFARDMTAQIGTTREFFLTSWVFSATLTEERLDID